MQGQSVLIYDSGKQSINPPAARFLFIAHWRQQKGRWKWFRTASCGFPTPRGGGSYF